MTLRDETESNRENVPKTPSERDLCREVEAYVVSRPWRALSIAITAGFVIGRFIL
ncbi:MAG TPA: DUF883 C-terminal domain-containing protein [Rhizomicrobium sp.]|jgi:ElaB/YqjD/DUF883 family membrane-anchored ribosome-binding protein